MSALAFEPTRGQPATVAELEWNAEGRKCIYFKEERRTSNNVNNHIYIADKRTYN